MEYGTGGHSTVQRFVEIPLVSFSGALDKGWIDGFRISTYDLLPQWENGNLNVQASVQV